MADTCDDLKRKGSIPEDPVSRQHPYLAIKPNGITLARSHLTEVACTTTEPDKSGLDIHSLTPPLRKSGSANSPLELPISDQELDQLKNVYWPENYKFWKPDWLIRSKHKGICSMHVLSEWRPKKLLLFFCHLYWQQCSIRSFIKVRNSKEIVTMRLKLIFVADEKCASFLLNLNTEKICIAHRTVK